MIKQNRGFTYIDVLIAISLMFIAFMFFVQLNQMNYRLNQKSEEINNMTMIEQGIMEVYRELGKDAAISYSQGYNVNIDEDTNTGHSGLTKVTLTLTPIELGLSPITLVSYHTSTQAPAVAASTAIDIADFGDGQDIEVTFNGAADETNVLEYRIFVVKSSQAGSFDVTTASSLDNTKYIAEAKSGNGVQHTVTLSSLLLTSDGSAIENGTAYKIFILTVGDNAYSDNLSPESNELVLAVSSGGISVTDTIDTSDVLQGILLTSKTFLLPDSSSSHIMTVQAGRDLLYVDVYYQKEGDTNWYKIKDSSKLYFLETRDFTINYTDFSHGEGNYILKIDTQPL